MKKCAACTRDSDDKEEFCLYHTRALGELKKHYGSWVNAYGGISWKDYLKRLDSMDETGQWIKEIIRLELKKEEDDEGAKREKK
jgi:hypothetical protein